MGRGESVGQESLRRSAAEGSVVAVFIQSLKFKVHLDILHVGGKFIQMNGLS
jgi:hypothetical protein